jgi:hypothetical protein
MNSKMVKSEMVVLTRKKKVDMTDVDVAVVELQWSHWIHMTPIKYCKVRIIV